MQSREFSMRLTSACTNTERSWIRVFSHSAFTSDALTCLWLGRSWWCRRWRWNTTQILCCRSKWFVIEAIQELFSPLQYWATLSKCFNWWVYFTMIGGVMSLTVNRFTAFIWPMKYRQVGATWTNWQLENCSQIWSKRTCLLVILACWIVPSPFGWMMLHPQGRSHLDKRTFWATFNDAEVREGMLTLTKMRNKRSSPLSTGKSTSWVWDDCLFLKVSNQPEYQMVVHFQRIGNHLTLDGYSGGVYPSSFNGHNVWHYACDGVLKSQNGMWQLLKCRQWSNHAQRRQTTRRKRWRSCAWRFVSLSSASPSLAFMLACASRTSSG